jgi:hypothetical protein
VVGCPVPVVLAPGCLEWSAAHANDDEEGDRVSNHKANGTPDGPLELLTVCTRYQAAIKHQDRHFGKARGPKENAFNDPSKLNKLEMIPDTVVGMCLTKAPFHQSSGGTFQMCLLNPYL